MYGIGLTGGVSLLELSGNCRPLVWGSVKPLKLTVVLSSFTDSCTCNCSVYCKKTLSTIPCSCFHYCSVIQLVHSHLQCCLQQQMCHCFNPLEGHSWRNVSMWEIDLWIWSDFCVKKGHLNLFHPCIGELTPKQSREWFLFGNELLLGGKWHYEMS